MEYTKIPNIYKREPYRSNKLIEGEYSTDELRYLADLPWMWTEKVDGTNIRVIWDGYRVSFAGRTDKAQIPSHLMARLEELFGGEVNEEMFEQVFGEKEVTLYGEGYGQKIQTNGYIDRVDFILFDVFVGDIILSRESVEGIAEAFNIGVVPIIFEGSLQEGIDYVKQHNKTTINDGIFGAYMEGLVARPKVEVRDRLGNRVIVKIKYSDFKEGTI